MSVTQRKITLDLYELNHCFIHVVVLIHVASSSNYNELIISKRNITLLIKFSYIIKQNLH